MPPRRTLRAGWPINHKQTHEQIPSIISDYYSASDAGDIARRLAREEQRTDQGEVQRRPAQGVAESQVRALLHVTSRRSMLDTSPPQRFPPMQKE